MPTDKDGLYPINYVAGACNISRASILRLEDEGILTPAYRDPESGYRYYSIENIALIADVLKYQNLGFTKKELKDAMTDSERRRKAIKKLKIKQTFLLRELEDIMAVIDQGPEPMIRKTYTLGGTFYSKEEEMIYTPKNLKAFAVNLMKEFVEKKIPGKPQITMKFFITDADHIESFGQFDGKRHKVRGIVPVAEGANVSGENFVKKESRLVYSLTYRCDFNRSEDLFKKIYERAVGDGYEIDEAIAIAALPSLFYGSDKDLKESTLRLILRTKETYDMGLTCPWVDMR